MKKLYEVRINTVDPYNGLRRGHRAYAYTLDANKAEELKARAVAELLARADWTIDTAKNPKTGAPDVEVVRLGKVWE